MNKIYYLHDVSSREVKAAFPNVGRAFSYCLEYYGSHITLSEPIVGEGTNVSNISGGLLATIRPLPFYN